MTLPSPLLGTLSHAELRPFHRAEHLMSMPAADQHRWTIEEVEQLVDEREGLSPRYELVDGELLVTPAPDGRHQRIVGALFISLSAYARRFRVGEVRLGPGEGRLTPDSRFEPDIFVIPAVGGRMPRASDPVTRLLLAVEVLSPSSSRHDRITKRRFFQKHGVPEYWVVDGEAEAFEVWHPGDDRAALLDVQLTWQPIPDVAPFELDIKAFFAAVADEA
ncbi:MAG: Uma2 family endonuclease [Gemmatimonadaceae bacterium]